MKIKEITGQHRRDFDAILICQHCDHEQELTRGYDDRNYHDNVIPKIECEACHKAGGEPEYRGTKYAANEVV